MSDENSVIEEDIVEPIEEVVEQEAAEPQEAPPETPAEPEPVVFDERQQAKFNEAIAKKVAKAHEAERRAVEAERRYKELESKQPKETRPEVPEAPDAYDEDYREKIRQRDEALLNQARYDANQKAQVEQFERQKQETMRQQQEAAQKSITEFKERAVKIGLTEQELVESAQMVGAANLNDELNNYLLSDPSGPLITKYLARNPLKLDELKSMGLVGASVELATTIKQAAQGMIKKVERPDDPAEPLSGGRGSIPSGLPAEMQGGTFS